MPFPDVSMQATELASPAAPAPLLRAIHQEDLAGEFRVHLRVNPDLPFDKQTVLQLAQFFFPVLLERYPLGARELAKLTWEIHGQKGFDTIWPRVVAELETQRLMTMLLLQVQQLLQPPQPPPEAPVRSQETQQAVDQADQAQAMADRHAAEQQMQQDQMGTAQEMLRLLQQRQQLEHDRAMAQLKQAGQRTQNADKARNGRTS